MAKVNPGGYRGVWNTAGGNNAGFSTDMAPGQKSAGGAGGPSYFNAYRNVAYGRWDLHEYTWRKTVGRAPTGKGYPQPGPSPDTPVGQWSGPIGPWTPTVNPHVTWGPYKASQWPGIVKGYDWDWVAPGKWEATGGVVTTPGDGYTYHTFDPSNPNPNYFTVTGSPNTNKGVEVVMGGQGGNGGQWGPGPGTKRPGGGGGGGGAILNFSTNWTGGGGNVQGNRAYWSSSSFTIPHNSGAHPDVKGKFGPFAGDNGQQGSWPTSPEPRGYGGDGATVPTANQQLPGYIQHYDGQDGENGRPGEPTGEGGHGGYGGAYPLSGPEYWWVPQYLPADRGLAGPVRGNEHEQNPWPGTSPSPIWRPGLAVGGGGGGGTGGQPNNGWPELPARPGGSAKMIIRYKTAD